MTFLAFAAGNSLALDVTTLYTAQVVVDQEQDDPRATAYAEALSAVLLRVTDFELSSDPELVALLFPSPASYVVQFRPGAEETLWVSFDGEAVERTLREAGRTVWGSDRPLTLVWLAVDWGQGEREIIGADDPERSSDEARSIDRYRLLRQRVLDVAERRGLPLVFPLLDTDDLQSVSFSDIWGGFDDQLLEASRRYDVSSILVGRIRPDSGQRDRWSYYFGNDEQSWSGEPELVVNLVADRLAAEFAISGSAPLEFIDLEVAGVESVASYAALQQLLADLTIVNSLVITEVVGDRIRYRIEAHGGAERLRRALQFNGLIEQSGFDEGLYPLDTISSSLYFFYNEK